MSWLLLVRPEAEQDLASACDWHDQKQPGLGDEYLDEVALAFNALAENSLQARLYFRQFRRVILRRFPYKISTK